jgi:hypothetical protein
MVLFIVKGIGTPEGQAGPSGQTAPIVGRSLFLLFQIILPGDACYHVSLSVSLLLTHALTMLAEIGQSRLPKTTKRKSLSIKN